MRLNSPKKSDVLHCDHSGCAWYHCEIYSARNNFFTINVVGGCWFRSIGTWQLRERILTEYNKPEYSGFVLCRK